MADILSNLRGTLQSFFKLVDAQIKRESSTVLSARNSADSAYINVRGADGATADDFVTYRQLNSMAMVIKIPFGPGAGAYNSASSIPNGAVITRVLLNISVAFDGAATVSVGTPASPSAYMTTAQNAPSVVEVYVAEQATTAGAASVVRVTVGGAPTVGSGTMYINYATPNT